MLYYMKKSVDITEILSRSEIPDLDPYGYMGDPSDYIEFEHIEFTSALQRPKQEIEAKLTDFITNELIIKDIDKSTNELNRYTNFLKLIFATFKKAFDEYKKNKNLDSNDIMFLYKGGCLLRIAYLRYKNTVLSKLDASIVEPLTNLYDKVFQISDADFTILINPRLENYDDVFHDVNKLTYYLTEMIRTEILNNLNNYLAYFKLSSNEKTEKLESLFQVVNNTNVLKNKRSNTTDTDSFVSQKIPIRSADTSLNGSELVALIFDNDVIKRNDIDLNKVEIASNRDELTESHLLTKSQLNSKKSDFYVRQHYHGIKKKWDDNKKMEISVLKKVNVMFPNFNKPPQIIYVTYNDTLHFKKSIYEEKYASFNLIRAKFNFVCILKEITQKENKYFKYNMGGELIDISIPSKEHYDMEEHYDHIHEITMKYIGVEQLDGLEFNGYTIEYLYKDIYYILFTQYKYPWLADKYEKRIKRIFALAVLILTDVKTLSEIQTIKSYIVSLIEKDLLMQKIIYKKYELGQKINDNDMQEFNNFKNSHDTIQIKQNLKYGNMMKSLYNMYVTIYRNLLSDEPLREENKIYTQNDAYIDYKININIINNELSSIKLFVEYILIGITYNLVYREHLLNVSKSENSLEINMLGGGTNYLDKYLLYKEKYLKLKYNKLEHR